MLACPGYALGDLTCLTCPVFTGRFSLLTFYKFLALILLSVVALPV